METVSEIVLESQVVILTGGVDKNGTPLITFPTDVADLVDIYSQGDILRLLQVCVRIAGGKVAVVADLQHDWTQEAITKLTTLLDELQTSVRRCLTTVYLIKPRARRKGKILYRELSRKYGPGRMVPFYTVKRLENYQELYTYIDKTDLTPDYGGTLQYDHLAWRQFHKIFYPVTNKAEKLLSDMASIKDGVIILLESAKEKDRLDDDTHTKEITAKYEALLSKANVRETLEECNKALLGLESSNNNIIYEKIHPNFLVKTTIDIRTMANRISAEIKDMDSMLTASTRVSDIHSRLRQCKENADEVIESIILLNEEIKCLPVIGNSVHEAHSNRQNFIKEILNPSKDIVACSTVILKQLDNGKDTTPKSYAASFEIAKQLTESLQPFTQTVNDLNEIYTRTHLFFVLFEKVTRWKSKACMFIIRNTNTSCIAENNRNNSARNQVVPNAYKVVSFEENSEEENSLMDNNGPTVHSPKIVSNVFTDDWTEIRKKFSTKHPVPKRRHLKILTKNVPDGIDRRLKDEANNLVERTIFILTFLDKDVYKSEDLALIQKWCHPTYQIQNLNESDGAIEISTV